MVRSSWASCSGKNRSAMIRSADAAIRHRSGKAVAVLDQWLVVLMSMFSPSPGGVFRLGLLVLLTLAILNILWRAVQLARASVSRRDGGARSTSKTLSPERLGLCVSFCRRFRHCHICPNSGSTGCSRAGLTVPDPGCARESLLAGCPAIGDTRMAAIPASQVNDAAFRNGVAQPRSQQAGNHCGATSCRRRAIRRRGSRARSGACLWAVRLP